MTTALAPYAPPPAITRAWAARGYPTLALQWHFEAMERRRRMMIAADTLAPRTATRTLFVAPPPDPEVAAANAALRQAVGPSIADIQRAVASAYSIGRADILGPRRWPHIIRPRQIAMYLAQTLTTASLPQIGRRFGLRDHTTVLHAVRKIGRLIAEDAELAARVGGIVVAIVGDG